MFKMFKKKELEDIDLMSLLDNLIITKDGKRHTIDNYIYELQQERDLYKEVIEEVREHITKQKGKSYKSLNEKATICNKYNELLQILDKAKGSE